MCVVSLVRLGPSAAVKEKTLRGLLGADAELPAFARHDLEDAQTLGSLELSGIRVSWEEVTAGRRGEKVPEPVAALQTARRAVDANAPFSIAAVETWQRALFGHARYRAEKDHVRGALDLLQEWMAAPSTTALGAGRQGALVLARLVEIRPFGEGAGRLARLAASHVMVRGGARPPVLVGADRARLDAALREAFNLATESLVGLLDEASERATDVLIQSLRRHGSRAS